MGFHGKDDYESIQRRYDATISDPLNEQIAALEKRIRLLKAKNKRLKSSLRGSSIRRGRT